MNKTMWSNSLLTLIVLFPLSVSSLQRGQILIKDNENAFRLAIRLERLEQYEDAEEIYLELLKNNPKDTRAYLQLKSMYRRLEKFSDLEGLIQNRLALFPNDLQSHAELGEVFLQQGEEEKALTYWDKVLLQFPRSRTSYHVLMQMYLKHQLEDRVHDLVAQGRETFDDPSFLSLELGNTYLRTQDVEKAADEFITFAIYHPRQLRTVSTYLMRMSDQSENQPIIENRLTARISEEEHVVRSLYSDFLFKIGRYEDAFDQHQWLGIKTNQDFDRWLQFANGLRKENELPLALDAFSFILDAIPGLSNARSSSHYRKITGEALYGLALTYERQIVPAEDFESLAGYFPNNLFFEDHFRRLEPIDVLPLEETFALYDSILTTLPSSSFSPQAHFRLGEIKYRVTRDFDGALNSYVAAESLARDRKLMRKASARIADVLMTKGDFQGALKFVDGGIKSATSDEEKTIYLIKKCHILFLYGEVDSTLACLDNLLASMETTDPYFNDVFELKGFMEENYVRALPEGKEAFTIYLNGEQLMKRDKLSEAQSFFAEVVREYSDAPIADEAAFRNANIYLLLNNNDAAISDFTALQDSPLGDLATVMIGEVYDRYLNNPQEAIQWYLAVLETYPKSVLTEPVRYRIRQLDRTKEFD